MDTLNQLTQDMAEFAKERDWDQFQSPKNLVMALSGEVGELTEHFQWLTEEQSKNLDHKTRAAVADEVADVLLYLVRLGDKLDMDIIKESKRKMLANALKYPADKVRGSAKKYTEY